MEDNHLDYHAFICIALDCAFGIRAGGRQSKSRSAAACHRGEFYGPGLYICGIINSLRQRNKKVRTRFLLSEESLQSYRANFRSGGVAE